jgi:hypothetical protein
MQAPSIMGSQRSPMSSQSTAVIGTSREMHGNIKILCRTQPSCCSTLHQTVQAGGGVRAWSLVSATTGSDFSFNDLATVPDALPPPPRTTVRGRKGVGAQDDDFRFDYGMAFRLHRQDALAKEGFPVTCDGVICKGKTEVYSRKTPSFIWSRDKSRGGALICPGKPGGRPHLYCLRCAETQYEAGNTLANQTDGKPVGWEQLFTKCTVFPDEGVVRRSSTDALQNERKGPEGSAPGFEFWVQHQGILCWPCLGQGLQVAKRTLGATRPPSLEGVWSGARVKRAWGTLLAPAIKAPEGPKVPITVVGPYNSTKCSRGCSFAVQFACGFYEH